MTSEKQKTQRTWAWNRALITSSYAHQYAVLQKIVFVRTSMFEEAQLLKDALLEANDSWARARGVNVEASNASR